MKSRIVFLGRNHSLKSRVVLKALLEADHEICLVIIPKAEFNYKKLLLSRQIISFPLRAISYAHYIKDIYINRDYQSLLDIADEFGLPTLHAHDTSLKSNIPDLLSCQPNIILSWGWGWIISSDAVNLKDVAIINCHSSFLPHYKGSAAYLTALINHEEYSGATVHYVSNDLDAGDIICPVKVPNVKGETPKSLNAKISFATVDVVKESIFRIENHSPTTKQGVGTEYEHMSLLKYNIVSIKNKLRKLFGRKEIRLHPIKGLSEQP